jgi:hypothetical protein
LMSSLVWNGSSWVFSFFKENHFSLVVATSIEYETDYCLRCGDYAELCNLSAVTRTVKNTLRLYFFPSSSLTAL